MDQLEKAKEKEEEGKRNTHTERFIARTFDQ
jgi:hypothetical protein